LSLPNLITLARLLSVPLAIWLILNDRLAAAFWLFVAAGISDAVDGFIAKRFDQRSELGALLDPLADKALLVSMYVTLGVANHLPNWLVILVVFRDILIIGGFLFAWLLTHPVRSRPLWISKLNTGLQIALIAFVLAHLGLDIVDDWVITAFIYTVGATTVLSGAGYLVRWGRTLAAPELGR
jgi:cardiolipin synthase